MQRLAVQIGGGQCGSEEIDGDHFSTPKGTACRLSISTAAKIGTKIRTTKKNRAALRRCSSERCVKIALKWPGQTVAHK